MNPIENPIRSLAIGSFDGMHRAHRELLALADGVVVIERPAPRRLTPGYKRGWYCNKALFFYLFEKISHWSAEAFVAKLREDFPHLERIVVGYDFRFGRGRHGTPELLERYFDGEVRVVPEVIVEGISVHSRTIRELLQRAEIPLANRLLGRRYRIDGEPVAGQGLGSKSFVPTINLSVEGYQLPAEGVYAGYAWIEERRYRAAIFLGHRSTTEGGFAIEAHLLEHVPAVLGSRVFLEFDAFLRPNRRFESFQGLKEQILRDIEEAKRLL